jgi:hypothetical protein
MLAAVYGRTRGWSLLRLIDGGTGWISPADSGSSVSAERLALSADGIYDWDWTLASEPGGQQRTAVPRDPRRKWIGYLVERELVAGSVPVFATPDRSSPPVAEWDPAGDMRLAYVRPDGTIRAPRSLV